MVTDYQFRKKTLFIFHFFQVEPTILSSGRLILIKNLITTSGTDFSSSRNNFFRNCQVKTISSHFSRYYCHRKQLFHVVKNNFQRILHSGQWKLVFCLVETVCFCSELFSAVGNQQGESILKEKHFSASGNNFL